MLAPAATRRVARVWRAWWLVCPGRSTSSLASQSLNAVVNVAIDTDRSKVGLATRLGNKAITRRSPADGSRPDLARNRARVLCWRARMRS